MKEGVVGIIKILTWVYMGPSQHDYKTVIMCKVEEAKGRSEI